MDQVYFIGFMIATYVNCLVWLILIIYLIVDAVLPETKCCKNKYKIKEEDDQDGIETVPLLKTSSTATKRSFKPQT